MTGTRSGQLRTAAVLAALVASVVGLAACTTTQHALNGEQDKAASQVLVDAAKALQNAPGVHVVGHGRVMGITLDYDISIRGSDAIGRLRTSDGIDQRLLRVQGRDFVLGGASLGPEIDSRLKDRWVEQPPGSSLASLTTLAGLATSLTGQFKVDGRVTRSKRDGREVLVLTGNDLSGPATIEVALQGPPRPVHATSDGEEPGAEDYTVDSTGLTVRVPSDYVSAAEYRGLLARFGDSPASHIR